MPYALPGFQVEPEAAFWLESRTPIRVATIDEVLRHTEPPTPPGDPRFAIDVATDFPGTDAQLRRQYTELVGLRRTRDQPLPTADGQPSPNPGQFDPFPPPREPEIPPIRPPRPPRVPPLAVPPLSAFLQLRPPPFGAVFDATRPQPPVIDVVRQHDRITLATPAVITTGRELARAFENETPGLYHRHALNWLLFARPDISPPRQARIWMALDLAIYSALGAAWHYKWHRPPFRYLLRPSEYPVPPILDSADSSLRIDVLYDRIVDADGEGDGKPRTCPQPSPGTPRHPAWPSGHSTYGAAASYVLEYFFAGADSLTRSYAQVAAAHAAAQQTDPFGPDWIALHLRRLADNIGFARLYAGVHWRADHVAGQKIGRAAAQAIVDQLRADCVPDFVLRNCPDGAGVTPPDPDALATATRAARATSCPVDQDRLDQRPRGADRLANSGTF